MEIRTNWSGETRKKEKLKEEKRDQGTQQILQHQQQYTTAAILQIIRSRHAKCDHECTARGMGYLLR